jgi:hypothetical protein
MNDPWLYTTRRRRFPVHFPGGGGFIYMRPWTHGPILPPLEPDYLQSLPGEYTRDWTYSARRRRRIGEPYIGGGPGNPFAGIGPYGRIR